MIEQSFLTPAEIQRYSRHLILPEVGMEGQLRLKQSSVLIVGAGGLGSPLALYLAAAGIGRLGLVDMDVVDESNLQRQILHSTEMIGQSKLVSARYRIKELNPLVTVDCYETRLTSENALQILPDYDLVIDGTDNFPTRYLVNDACVLLGKPNVYGSIFRFEGQTTIFATKDGPCYRCLYPSPPPPGVMPSCAEGGVLGILPGIIGILQATEAIKWIIGKGEPLVGRLLLVDTLQMQFSEFTVSKNPDCPVCGSHATITQLIDYEAFCGLNTESQALSPQQLVSPSELAQELAAGRDLVLIDVREPHEWEICHLPNARLIPQQTLPGYLHTLNRSAQIVLYCRSGARSARAANLLTQAGFQQVRTLEGGLLRWAREVDQSMPTY